MATNFAEASYTEVVDLQTVSGRTSIIGIHTPVGVRPYTRLKGFFTQFKKYKYDGISSLIMVPAANLPVDPLGLTGVVGTTDLMDPRDALNPIIFHGAHGEHLSSVLDTIYTSNEFTNTSGDNSSTGLVHDVSDAMSSHSIVNTSPEGWAGDSNYYRCLTDVSWKKFGIQSGVKLRNLHPLVHRMARSMPLLPADYSSNFNNGQLVPPTSGTNNSLTTSSTLGAKTTGQSATTAGLPIGALPTIKDYVNTADSPVVRSAYVQEFTNGMQRLGWLPTSILTSASSTMNPALCMLPKLFMGVLVMPPSYNVEQYFRCVIRHHFSFKEFTSSLSLMDPVNLSVPSSSNEDSPYFNWIKYSSSGSKDVDNVGDTLDIVGGSAEIVSDGVN